MGMRCFFRLNSVFLCGLLLFCAVSCTFDYGITEAVESPYPDITMEDLDYVRVRKGGPIARLQAEIAERYEKRHRMELKNYSFEQYNTSNDEIDAVGSGGFASIELDTSNIHMSSGIEIIVDSEDITLGTERLDWEDSKKYLRGGDNDPVNIEQSDGTMFTGSGFSADVRARSWFVSSNAEGAYVHEDDDEESGEEDETTENETAESDGVRESDGARESGGEKPAAESSPMKSAPAEDTGETVEPQS
jgi:LPS export ABC transporter protein LptC